MDWVLLETAQRELEEAADYYEGLQTGLGIALAEEVYSSLDRVCEQPEAYPVAGPYTRRCLTHRFKYGIVYEIDGEMIIVYAIVHERRDPASWNDLR